MPNYRRAYHPGGTFFFTVVTDRRRPLFRDARNRQQLRDAMLDCLANRPFETVAAVLLPDHLHMISTLPENDTDFSTRRAAIKSHFTRAYLATGGGDSGVSPNRREHGGRGVWQERFWEHRIRDMDDFENHLNYIHYNPVKHGYAKCPHEWQWSTFAKWIKRDVYTQDWQCTCDGRRLQSPDFGDLDVAAME